ncbi:MAG: hypothetical protein HY738_04265 [Bacteroidia bacterium]|nr:hypothetical protein [Bacteroidia bacterium]
MNHSMKLFSFFLQILFFTISVLACLFYALDIIEEGLFLSLTYIFIGIALTCLVIFIIYNIVINFKETIKSLVGIAILLIILGIAFLIASGTIPASLNPEKLGFTLSAISLRFIDTGLIGLYILLIIAALAVVVTEIAKLLR